MKNNSISESDIFALCQSGNNFPVDFDLAWRWLGFARKDPAKRNLLSSGFAEDIDYTISIHSNVELDKQRNPKPQQIIQLTIELLPAAS